MASPSSALVLKFSADVAGAQKSLGDFAANAVTNLAKISQQAITAKKTLDFLNANSGLIKVGVAGVAGVVALEAAVNLVSAAAQAAQDNLANLIKIGSGAANAGVGTSFFQGWTQQAKELNLETSDLVAMLEKARVAATQTIGDDGGTSSSPGSDRILKNVRAGNLGASALTTFNGADTQEARIRVILDLIQQLQQKGDQLAAFDLGKTFFGSAFEAQLRDGVDMIGKMRDALGGLSVAGGARVIPDEEIANAQRLNAEMDAINNRLANQMRPVLEEISSIEQGSLQILVNIKAAFADIVDIASDVSRVLASWTIEPFMRGVRLDIDAFVNMLRPLNDLLYGKGFLENAAVPSSRPSEGQGRLRFDQKDNPTLDGGTLPAITVRGDRSNALPSLTPKPKSDAADQVETYINSLKKQTAAEQAEAQTLGLSNQARQEAVDLAKAQEAASERKKPLTDAETAQVKQLADAYVAAKKSIDDYAKSQEDAKATAMLFGDALESALDRLTEPGARLQDILKGIVQSLEQAAIKALVLGEGPLASLFGTGAASGATGTASIGGLFGGLVNGAGSLLGGSVAANYAASAANAVPGSYGPGFATAPGGSGLLGLLGGLGGLFSGFHAAGGSIPSGHWGVAGEVGAEIINGPATVTPIAQINAALRAGGGRGGGHSVNMAINVSGARGNAEIHQMVASGVQAGMSDVYGKITRDIGPIVSNWNRRNG